MASRFSGFQLDTFAEFTLSEEKVLSAWFMLSETNVQE